MVRPREVKKENQAKRRRKRRKQSQSMVGALVKSGELCVDRRCRGDCGRWHLL